MYKKAILMAGILGMFATSSVYAEEFPIEGVTIEGSTEIAIGEVDENGNPIPITIGNTLTEEEKEQRNPILSIEETRLNTRFSSPMLLRRSTISLRPAPCEIVLETVTTQLQCFFFKRS